ncbi:hypothetical protein K469DRAFT_720618 [Zopfia rhizophila CBS 207.26]|uniref:Indole-diterpene biosynthesis protein-like protein PaxU n=1 Tax=Zopfia rhizophila CBS 207.26 TaxID=1314779 RepID=A0A6A6EKU5_9PEZI|nr:hypothetical protein K469DRAFT_720618 [Zopfia rhizophila CBS 207.26]
MADPITRPIITEPLSEFQKIGYNTYFWTSESFDATSPLILLFAWNAAAAKHIAKYTVAYRKLFPSSRILLIRCNTPDMLRAEKSYRKLLSPAFEIVRGHVKSGGEVLVHSFSNGGANQLVQFAKLWRRTEGSLLPVRAQVLDSSPGKGAWKRSHSAIKLSLPRAIFFRIFGSLLAHLLLVAIFVVDRVMRREHMIVVMCRLLNDPSLFQTKAPRVYLYSKADAMVGDDEVEEHADEAASKGWEVEKVKFEKSPHAGHIREDKGKYWKAVMAAWERGG